MKKVAIFLDGGNLFFTQKKLGWKIDSEKLLSYCKKHGEVVEAIYYTGVSQDINQIKFLDKLAYIVALGLDVGQNDKLKLSIQLSKPKVRFRRLFRRSSRKYYKLGRMLFYKRWIRPF